MMRIHYAGGSELTGTTIADAVMDLAEEFGRSGTAGTVEIPVRQPDGSIGRCRLLIGPASQIAAESENSDYEEVTDPELVAALLRRAEALRPHTALNSESPDDLGWDPEVDSTSEY
jgi:hypothetical protein